MDFEIVGDLSEIEVIAVNFSIRELAGLKEKYGGRRWLKLKGVALVSLANGHIRLAEIHWYEAHGVGQRKLKIKCFLD
jgi:hypothetical protein